MDFSDAVINGIPLVIVIIGLVEFSKKFGLAGKWLTGLSMALGLLFGMLYQLSLGTPVDLAGWFAAAVYGLGLGLEASGLYDAILRRI